MTVDPNRQTYTYKYDFEDMSDVSPENLEKWIEEVKKGSVKNHYKSSTPPLYPKYSRKVIGSTFAKDILENDVD